MNPLWTACLVICLTTFLGGLLAATATLLAGWILTRPHG